jgi:hypothetical protein
MNLCEIPFISATAFDEALTSSGPGRSAMQKYRQEMRRTLDKGKLISMGRAGTVQLTSVPALACLATATRWNMKDARKLADVYKKAGFSKLTKSKEFNRTLTLASEAIQALVRKPGADTSKAGLTEMIPGCWESLTVQQDAVRKLTGMMSAIFDKVDGALAEMKRYPGRLVRFEGENALISVKNSDQRELRLVNSAYLRAAGISRNGMPLMVHEYHWSPDTTMTVYFPAIDLDHDPVAEVELMAHLKSLEQPLPEPPPGSFPIKPAVIRKAEPSSKVATAGHGRVKARDLVRIPAGMGRLAGPEKRRAAHSADAAAKVKVARRAAHRGKDAYS